MTSRLDLIAPQAVTMLATTSLSSLAILPPGGISLGGLDPGDPISVTLTASNAATRLTAAAGGAAIMANENNLTITGNFAAVNAALASLGIAEPGNALTDLITIDAADTLSLPVSTEIAVDIMASTGPAFAAPPVNATFQPFSLSTVSGLVIGDPEVAGLVAAGLGQSETLALTLTVSAGVLLLPDLNSLDGISAAGNGSNQIILSFTADQLVAVNAVLSGLAFAAPAQSAELFYALRNAAGPLGAASTSGNIALSIAGAPGPRGTTVVGADTAILNTSSLAAGATMAISGTTADIGGIEGAGAISIGLEAALQLPYDYISLGGSSLDFGTLNAVQLFETGALVIAGAASFAGPASLAANGFVDFTGSFTAVGGAQTAYVPGLSLAAGAELDGSGTLIAGNFNEAGMITGPGTILAVSTLLLSAGSLGGGAHLDIAPGGAVVLGPVDPLYGVAAATPLTVDSSVTLSFLGNAGAGLDTGPYAGTLGESGGVIVINGAQVFNGTITGFAPGDRLIFPDIVSGFGISNTMSNSFVVTGADSSGVNQAYTIHAAHAAGTSLVYGTDAAGNNQIGLRDSAPDLFINASTITNTEINAVTGLAAPLQGLDLLVPSWSGQTLTLTLAVSHGTLSSGLSTAASLTLTAASPTALDEILSQAVYTAGTGTADHLNITSASGLLAGLSGTVPIVIGPSGGTIQGFGTLPVNASQTLVFGGASGAAALLTQSAAPGEIIVTGYQDFAGSIDAAGLGGTALLIGGGGTGLFDAAAHIALGADAVVGNTAGSGYLDILTPNFILGADSAANLTLAAAAAAAGSAVNLLGTIGINGTLLIGPGAAASFEIAGQLGAVATSIFAGSRLDGFGSAAAAFGTLSDAGTLNLVDDATASAGSLLLDGSLTLGGTAMLHVQGNASLTGGEAVIGPDATLSAANLVQTGGSLTLAGALDVTAASVETAAVTLDGGHLAAPRLTLETGATLTGTGNLTGTGSGIGSLIIDGGALDATGGELVLADDIQLQNGGSIGIGPSAEIDLIHGLTGGAVNFTGPAAVLVINDLAKITTAITGMTGHDMIDLAGITGNVTFANGSLTASDAGGHLIGGFALMPAAAQPAVQLLSDGTGGTLVTLGGEMPCFVRGTRLLTPHGYRPVETLAPGDPVITYAGERRPVRWIGRRTLDLGARKPMQDARPVRITANAFGPGLPAQDIRLSPLHAVFTAGVLVPAQHLVNGATIVQEAGRLAVTYYHIELDRHDIVLAEGLPAETYLDTGNRAALYHETGRRGTARRPCAPLVTTGPVLAAIRRRLHAIALAAGFVPAYAPALRAVVNRQTVLPRMLSRHGRHYAHFSLPAAAHTLHLLAQSAAPADTAPEAEDRRELALCISTIKTANRHLPLTRDHLATGWFERAAQDTGYWMGSTAAIRLPPQTSAISLGIAGIVQSWTR